MAEEAREEAAEETAEVADDAREAAEDVADAAPEAMDDTATTAAEEVETIDEAIEEAMLEAGAADEEPETAIAFWRLQISVVMPCVSVKMLEGDFRIIGEEWKLTQSIIR